MTENQVREKIVNIAKEYLGCKESDGSHKKIVDLYNSHTPLARNYKLKYSDAWCAGYVSAMAIKAGFTDIIPTEVGCYHMIEGFKKLGSWQENDAYVPKAGDVIFYDWSDSGVGDNTTSPDHVGLVTSCDGKTITVIEGNKANAVGYRTLNVNGRYIRGFGVPKYEVKAMNYQSTENKRKPIICLSPSNQDGNKYAYGNTTEAAQCQCIADAAKIAMERCGIEVVMANNSLGMAKKCQISDAAGADLHWPVHTNAHGKAGETNGGTHMYASSATSSGGKACEAVLKYLAPLTPGSSGESKVYTNTSWYEIVTPKAPTIYQETEYHDVPEYAKWIIEHTEDIAEAMAKGACDYFGLTYVPKGTKVEEPKKEELIKEEPKEEPKQEEKKVEKRYYYRKEVTLETYNKTLNKLIEKGLLKGKGGEGENMILDMSEDCIRILVVLDRAGKFDD